MLVFRVAQREAGLIVPELADIRDVATNVDTMTFRQPGVMGSMLVDDKTTRLLDLFESTQAAHPGWFAATPLPQTQESGAAPTIVLAKDSGFFRKQLSGVLTAKGYTVLACEDGQAAWDTLRKPGQPCDLLVTDLEMRG